MKRILMATLIGGVLPLTSYAQSTVTLYGDIGGGMRWTNGQKGGATVGFNNNIVAGNQFGFFGKEDLGGDLQAIFKLEGAFNSGTGALKNAGTLFSQAAFVGLKGDFGRLTFGRQLNANEDFSILIDPAGGQGQSLAIEPGVVFDANYFTLDSRFNNTIKYLGQAGGFRFGASYSPGGVAGNTRAGTNYSGAAMYQWGPAFGGASYQKTWNATATQWAQTFQTGGSLQVGPARLYLSYADLEVTAANAAAPNRRDHIPGGGVVLVPAASLQFTAAFYDDIASHLRNAQSASGHKITTYAIAEYLLSKRTELYAEADYNGFSGAYRFDPSNIAALGTAAGTRSTTGVSLGVMTRF
ncbi:porin [Paraburkholderia silviterrae]|uniref:Porin n=1 Tax=Paraburkholderia silviterrae TaxID=2528715 RepID=A0A4R5M9K7_9BURK|nr:porin [Paraburkholderia silviterrae]TDG23306.1 porin [Paraburkholderia silviterrae]